jgi:hypothetical protein
MVFVFYQRIVVQSNGQYAKLERTTLEKDYNRGFRIDQKFCLIAVTILTDRYHSLMNV